MGAGERISSREKRGEIKKTLVLHKLRKLLQKTVNSLKCWTKIILSKHSCFFLPQLWVENKTKQNKTKYIYIYNYSTSLPQVLPFDLHSAGSKKSHAQKWTYSDPVSKSFWQNKGRVSLENWATSMFTDEAQSLFSSPEPPVQNHWTCMRVC